MTRANAASAPRIALASIVAMTDVEGFVAHVHQERVVVINFSALPTTVLANPVVWPKSAGLTAAPVCVGHVRTEKPAIPMECA